MSKSSAAVFPRDTYPTKYSLIISHNSRIQCLLDNFRPAINKTRFQNGCVLKIVISPTPIYGSASIYVELLYSGSISESDERNTSKIFYCSDKDDRLNNAKKYIKFEKINIKKRFPDIGLRYKVSNIHVFYVVRHGKSEHNEGFTFHLTLDTQLIDTQSIETSATSIRDDLLKLKSSDPNIQLTNFFVSDLLRSRQTLNTMRTKWNTMTDINSLFPDIAPVVLPCASEVAKVGKNGDCDSSVSIMQKGALENYPSCTVERIKSDDKCKANWDLYFNFYNQQMRGQDDTFSGMFRKKTPRMRCRDTNMLALAIYHIDFIKMSLPTFIGKPLSGGRKRTRKNRSKV